MRQISNHPHLHQKPCTYEYDRYDLGSLKMLNGGFFKILIGGRTQMANSLSIISLLLFLFHRDAMQARTAPKAKVKDQASPGVYSPPVPRTALCECRPASCRPPIPGTASPEYLPSLPTAWPMWSHTAILLCVHSPVTCTALASHM